MTCEAWPIIGCDTGAAAPDIYAAAMSAAQQFLGAITGGRLGVCDHTQRFQVRSRIENCYPVQITGLCCAIALPNTPVQAVTSVTLDGVLLAPTDYDLVGGNKLVKVGCWPVSGDCVAGRVVVKYTAGLPLTAPVMSIEEPATVVTPASTYYAIAGAAMGEVTREYIEAMCGRPCKLPSRFATVSRQGVNVVGLSPELFLRLGLTGLPMTDNLVRTVNPHGLKRRPRVVSIDGPRRH